MTEKCDPFIYKSPGSRPAATVKYHVFDDCPPPGRAADDAEQTPVSQDTITLFHMEMCALCQPRAFAIEAEVVVARGLDNLINAEPLETPVAARLVLADLEAYGFRISRPIATDPQTVQPPTFKWFTSQEMPDERADDDAD